MCNAINITKITEGICFSSNNWIFLKKELCIAAICLFSCHIVL
jgi:hypothetical protein